MDIQTKIRVYRALTRAGGDDRTLKRFVEVNAADREFMAFVRLIEMILKRSRN